MDRLQKAVDFKKRRYGKDAISRQKRKIKYLENLGANIDFEVQALKALEESE